MPHREDLLRKLAAYRPWDADDRARAARIADFVRGQPDCFQRTLLAGHITGSAWVMDPPGQRVLLTFHRKLEKWLQLGGHADGESDVLAVARREAQEESGLAGLSPVSTAIFDVDIHVIPARPAEPAHLHYDIRFAFRAPGTAVALSAESRELAWVPLDRLEETSDEPSLLRMRAKWKALA